MLLFAFAALQSPQAASPPAIQQTPVIRTTSAQSPDAVAARQAAGLALAQLLFPIDRQKALLDRAARSDIRSSLLKDEGFVAMEAETPGLLAAILDAMIPVLHRSIEHQLPGYHRGIAAIYARHMTIAELGDAHRFFSSPSGQSLVTKVNDNTSFSTIIDRALVDPDAPVRRADIDKTKNDAAQRTVDSLTGAELAATAQGLIGKSWVTRLPAVRSDVSAFDEKFYNASDPALDKELDGVLERAMTAFLAKHEKSTKK